MNFLTMAELRSLKDRYIHETPPLSDLELADLRMGLPTKDWIALERDKNGKYETEAEATGQVTLITAGRTDHQIAADIRADLHGRLEAISEIMTKAKREHGLSINFGFTPPDSFGRVSLAVLEISKKLC